VKAALFYGPRDYRVERIPDPACGPSDILIEVKANAVCGTDVKAYQSGHSLIRSYPVITGHELAGVAVEVGEKVRDFEVAGERRRFHKGQRLVVAPVVACERCSNCKAGRPEMCERREDVGFKYNGGYAEMMLIPGELLSKGICPVWEIPEGVPYWTAAVCEPAACAIHAQKKMARFGGWDKEAQGYPATTEILPGDVVVVIGGGPLGLIHCELAKSSGAKVILAQRSRHKLEWAEAEGVANRYALNSKEGELERVVGEVSGGAGADIVITSCPDPGAQVQAVAIARRGGCVSFFGSIPKEAGKEALVPLPTNVIHNNGPALVGTSGASPYHIPIALLLAGRGSLSLDRYITHLFPLELLERVLMTRWMASEEDLSEVLGEKGNDFFEALVDAPRGELFGALMELKGSIMKALAVPSMDSERGLVDLTSIPREEKRRVLAELIS